MTPGGRIRADGQHGNQGGDERRDLLLAIDAQHDARQGNAHLASRDIVVQLVRVLQDGQQRLGKPVALFGHLDNARLAGANRRKLAGHVQPVEKDHCGHDDDNNQDENESDDNENNGDEDSFFIEILHPKTNGIYVNNKKINFPCRKLIIFGELDIRVNVQDHIDQVNFIINGNLVFEDFYPPYIYQIDDSCYQGRLFITIQAVRINSNINYSKIDTLLNRVIDEIRPQYWSSFKNNFNSVIQDVTSINDECIKICHENHFDLLFIKIL